MAKDKIIPVGDAIELIPLGMESTLNTGCVRFDISAWLTKHGAGTVEIYHRRATDTEAYKAAHVTQADGVVTWTLDAVDTAVQGYGEVSVRFKQNGQLIARTSSFLTFTGGVVVESGIDPPDPSPENIYDGSYEATSQIGVDVILETAQKYLTENVVVKEIPYQEVSNPSGGITITIGG